MSLKDTRYVWGKKWQNLQLPDILTCNSANIDQGFQKLLIVKLLIFAVFASYIASIPKLQTSIFGVNINQYNAYTYIWWILIIHNLCKEETWMVEIWSSHPPTAS